MLDAPPFNWCATLVREAPLTVADKRCVSVALVMTKVPALVLAVDKASHPRPNTVLPVRETVTLKEYVVPGVYVPPLMPVKVMDPPPELAEKSPWQLMQVVSPGDPVFPALPVSDR